MRCLRPSPAPWSSPSLPDLRPAAVAVLDLVTPGRRQHIRKICGSAESACGCSAVPLASLRGMGAPHVTCQMCGAVRYRNIHWLSPRGYRKNLLLTTFYDIYLRAYGIGHYKVPYRNAFLKLLTHVCVLTSHTGHSTLYTDHTCVTDTDYGTHYHYGRSVDAKNKPLRQKNCLVNPRDREREMPRIAVRARP